MAEPLTDEQIIEHGRYWSNERFAVGASRFLIDFARAIEQAHGIGVRHCGNCADGVPGGPDNCSRCGRDAPQYSHWTPADIAAQEALAAEQVQDMQRRAEDDAHALDPDDEPTYGVALADSKTEEQRK